MRLTQVVQNADGGVRKIGSVVGEYPTLEKIAAKRDDDPAVGQRKRRALHRDSFVGGLESDLLAVDLDAAIDQNRTAVLVAPIAQVERAQRVAALSCPRWRRSRRTRYRMRGR